MRKFSLILTIFAGLIGSDFPVLMPASAATRTWSGVNTNWNDPVNWDGTVPGAGDDVVVPNTAVKPSMSGGVYPPTGSFASFEVQAGAIVYCLGDTNVINEASGGTINKKHGIGVVVNAQNALIDGTLEGNGQGFGGETSYCGPGSSGSKFGGVSHGGLGGSPNASCYGSLFCPTALGSAGYNDWDQPVRPPGGGAIKLTATESLLLNGIIRCNGLLTHNGSSGGSVWLQAGTFAGAGLVSADGGASRSTLWYGGGGGGRIAIEYGV